MWWSEKCVWTHMSKGLPMRRNILSSVSCSIFRSIPCLSFRAQGPPQLHHVFSQMSHTQRLVGERRTPRGKRILLNSSGGVRNPCLKLKEGLEKGILLRRGWPIVVVIEVPRGRGRRSRSRVRHGLVHHHRRPNAHNTHTKSSAEIKKK